MAHDDDGDDDDCNLLCGLFQTGRIYVVIQPVTTRVQPVVTRSRVVVMTATLSLKTVQLVKVN